MDRVYRVGIDEVPKRLTLKEAEELRLVFVVMPGISADVPFDISIEREGVKLEIYGLYLCPRSEQVNFRVRVRHLVGGSTSTQLFKGIAGGSARVGFDGLIYIAPDAQKTKAFQENHTLLLSDSALIDSRPQLEIYADDVECSHGATTGSLNPEELFYMRSRGIPEELARRIQIHSFISPVLKYLPEEYRRQILARL